VVESIILDLLGLKNEIIVIEIPLMFETGLDELVDLTVSVIADKEKLIKRLRLRGISCIDARRRLVNQMSDSFKINKSDAVIFNNGSLDGFKADLRVLFKALVKLKKEKE
jgi:dephospho-CoA kinase